MTIRNAIVLSIAMLTTACAASTSVPSDQSMHFTPPPIVEDFGANRYYRIQFEPGSATLTNHSYWKVEKAIGMWVRVQMKSFELWGHGDPGQPRTAADRLAIRRMNAIVARLRYHGLAPKTGKSSGPRKYAGAFPSINLHRPSEPTPPNGIENDRSPVESSVEIYCSDGELPSMDGVARTP